MKIAMLTSWDEPCGIADYSRALVTALQKHVSVKVFPILHGQQEASYFRRLGQACNDCDLAHIQHEYIFFGGRDPWNCRWQDVLRELRIPLVVTSHTWLQYFSGGPVWKQVLRAARDSVYKVSGWRHYLEAGQFQSAGRILVHTRAHRQALLKRGLDSEKVVVVPQGVVQNIFPGNAARARAQWSLDGKVVAIFGFLIPSKGHLLALRAWQSAPENAALLIIGKAFSQADAAYARLLEKQTEKFAGSVRMTGYLAEEALADLLAAADLVLLPYTSGTSSYSLSLLFALGRAVLASDLDCFREIYEQKPCLELFAANDAASLARALRKLLKDEKKLTRLRREAQAWAKEHSWDKIATVHMKVYTDLLR